MQNFMARPALVEAIRVAPENYDEIGSIKDATLIYVQGQDGTEVIAVEVKTFSGRLTADMGDWITVGIKGGLGVCKPDVFELMYEAVSEEGGSGE